MTAFRVLSFDGGGIRGLVTAILLQRLTAEPDLARLLDGADLLAGTSTGGLLALGIAAGIDLSEIRRVYVEDGPRIFDDSLLDDLVDLGRLRGADYELDELRRVLREMLRLRRLGDLGKRVLITSFDLDNEDPDPARRTWKPKLFHNFPGPGSDRDMPAWKVGLYTAAAPTYFPSADGYVDGGVYAANPSMCALAQTQDRRYAPTPPLDEVVLLSLGTGTSLEHVEGERHDWGYAQWLKPLVSLMLDGTAGVADYQCRQMLGSRYHRLAPVFPPGVRIPMDGVRHIPRMIEFAEEVPLAETADWLRRNWLPL